MIFFSASKLIQSTFLKLLFFFLAHHNVKFENRAGFLNCTLKNIPLEKCCRQGDEGNI